MTGGLYTRVTKGWAVEAFNDWCFDASRKDGDTGVVDTTYGSHVMYFVGYGPARLGGMLSPPICRTKASSEWSDRPVRRRRCAAEATSA